MSKQLLIDQFFEVYMNELRIGLVSVSDRASSGIYEDKGIPALEEWLAKTLQRLFVLKLA